MISVHIIIEFYISMEYATENEQEFDTDQVS